MPHKTASIFNPCSSPSKPSKPTACNMKFVICHSNKLWSIQIKASHKRIEQHSNPNHNIITLGCVTYNLQTLQITSISITASILKKQYSIIPYIPNRILLSLAMVCCCLNGVKATPLLQDTIQDKTYRLYPLGIACRNGDITTIKQLLAGKDEPTSFAKVKGVLPLLSFISRSARYFKSNCTIT